MLNQVYERDTDALMRRTRSRPLPDGRVPPADARMFGLAARGGAASRCSRSAPNVLAALARARHARHLSGRLHADEAAIVARDARRRGAGALPPLIGWAAAHGSALVGGWTLFAIVFLWQIPHFMAIAWMYRDDYGKAGFPMLPVVEPDGRRTGRQAVVYAAALVPVSLCPTLVGVSGWPYFWIALRAGRRRCSGWRSRFAVDAIRTHRRARCSTDRSPTCRSSGRDDSRPLIAGRLGTVTVHDLPAVNATLNAISGVLLRRSATCSSARGASSSIGACMIAAFVDLVAVPRLLPRLPRAGRFGAVHAAGLRAARSISRS